MILAGGASATVPIDDPSRVGQARRGAVQLASDLGFDETDAGRVALVAMELATNVLKHARRGALRIQRIAAVEGDGVEVLAVDHGPGFDFTACLADGFSTQGTQGIGLGAVARQAQVLDLYADARGSVVMARMYPRHRPHRDLRYGGSSHSLAGHAANGDAWRLGFDGSCTSALLIDGLGHGEAAQQAARAGVDAFDEAPFDEASALMERLHAGMSGTRGGAVAIAQFDGGGRVRFTGIGNLAASLHAPDRSRGLASHPGIVGTQFRRAHAFDYADADGRLLVMHSDGLQSRWDLRDYPGLFTRHPSVIAAVLLRDFDRGRDDATVLAVTLGAAA